jgi:hypothetical protein
MNKYKHTRMSSPSTKLVLELLEKVPDQVINQILNELELYFLSSFLKRKFPNDPRTNEELVDLIKDELFPDNSFSNITYMQSKRT